MHHVTVIQARQKTSATSIIIISMNRMDQNWWNSTSCNVQRKVRPKNWEHQM